MISRQTLACFAGGENSPQAVPARLLDGQQLAGWLAEQAEPVKNWIKAQGFSARPNTFCFIPDDKGEAAEVLLGVDSGGDFWQLAAFPLSLPEGHYRLMDVTDAHWEALALGWGLGAYQFTAFKAAKRAPAVLQIPETADVDAVQSRLQAWYLVRDLINMPAESMGPEQLAQAASAIARHYQADMREIVGEALLEQNYPAIHTVGRGSSRAPRLIDLRWGDPQGRKITLIGKGVCFDSGGLDLKSSAGMLTMKKDMGGAAHVLGLACLIMDAALPVNLRVLIPAVENAVSGSSYKPGDVIATRKGLSVEIGNTDAEGRLILADALAEAVSENPELIIDFATLTGAARVALGPEIPVMFANHDETAEALLQSAQAQHETLWRLPLYKPYREYLDSPIADVNNSSSQPYAGAITAALFLQEFAGETPWVHFDIMGWNIADKPGRPRGGEAMGLLAVFDYIQKWFAE